MKDTLHEKAVRLAEGGTVEIEGHFVRAVDVIGDVDPCDLCEMDSVCHMVMTNLCAEVDGYTHTRHLLKFANKIK